MEKRNLQQEIMNLLQISPEKYNQLVFETGIGYLENYLNHSKLLVRDFSLHAGFWSWWKLQYRLVDEAFLRRYRNTNYPARQLVEFYIHSHLAMDKHIDRVVWKMVEEKRDEMIHKLIKKEVNNEH